MSGGGDMGVEGVFKPAFIMTPTMLHIPVHFLIVHHFRTGMVELKGRVVAMVIVRV